MIFTTKSHYHNFDVICLNHIYKYRNWHFEYCCPLLRHACVRADFLLLHIKTKGRNRMNAEDDIRLALSNTQPQGWLHRHKPNHHIEYKQLIVNKIYMSMI